MYDKPKGKPFFFVITVSNLLSDLLVYDFFSFFTYFISHIICLLQYFSYLCTNHSIY